MDKYIFCCSFCGKHTPNATLIQIPEGFVCVDCLEAVPDNTIKEIKKDTGKIINFIQKLIRRCRI